LHLQRDYKCFIIALQKKVYLVIATSITFLTNNLTNFSTLQYMKQHTGWHHRLIHCTIPERKALKTLHHSSTCRRIQYCMRTPPATLPVLKTIIIGCLVFIHLFNPEDSSQFRSEMNQLIHSCQIPCLFVQG